MEKPDLSFPPFLRIYLVCLCFLPSMLSLSQEKREIRELQKLQNLGTEQLKFSLEQYRESGRTGKILTIAGMGAGIVGGILGQSAIAHAGNWSKVPGIEAKGTALYVMEAGLVTAAIGIPLWIGGEKKRKRIELALARTGPAGNIHAAGLRLNLPLP